MLRVLALIERNKHIIGARVSDELTGEVVGLSLEQLKGILMFNKCYNVRIVGEGIDCVDGSVSSLPVIEEETGNIRNKCIAIVGKLLDSYMTVDVYGTRITLPEDEAITAIERHKCYNAKVVRKGGYPHISAIKGTFREFYIVNGEVVEGK